MPMTEAQKKEARRAASRKWYLAHKAKGATNKPRRAKPAEKKLAKKTAVKAVEKKPAKKTAQVTAAAKKPVKAAKKSPVSDLQKRLDRLVKKNEKTAAAYKNLVKESAALVQDVVKLGDEKLSEKTIKTLCKNLHLGVSFEKDGENKGVVSPVVEALSKCFKTPKAKKAAAEPAPEKKEIPVDPADLAGIEAGDVDVQDPDDEPLGEEDEDEEDGEGETDEDDEPDPEDMTPEEREEWEERRREKEAEAHEKDWIEGREDVMHELEAMGLGEED